MDHVTYDDDGTPVLREASGRGGAGRLGSGSGRWDWPGDLGDIFEIDGHSYDVVFTQTKISWCSVTGSGKVPKSRRKGIFKNRRKSTSKLVEGTGEDDPNTLFLKNIIGVKIKRLRQAGQGEGQGLCQGVVIYSYDRKEVQRFKDRVIVLGHPSEQICMKWCQRLQEIIAGFESRPKKAKVFLQPFAGKKYSRTVYNYQVKPLFESAGLEADVVEVTHNEHIKQEMIHLDLSAYDCLVCIGGDGTVSKVVNGLLNKTQHDMHIDIDGKPDFKPARPPIPLGIIPTGMTNMIVHSVQGVEDPVTAAIHIVLGHRVSVDVSSVYSEDKLCSWSFNCHYGFFGETLKYLNRYSLFGEKKLNAAFVKALTLSKFRPYECEIQYIPCAEECGNPMDGITCRKGCRLCRTDLSASQQSGSTFCDEVQVLDSFNESNTSSGIIDLSKEGNDVPWKTIKGEFFSISLYTLPGLSELAPQGCSKYTHLADGCLDLVLVSNTERREFVRYLKRHSNSKNQFNFPFIETKRCKEVRFHIRFKHTWEHKDYSFSEIDYEMSRRVSRSAESTGRPKKKTEEVVVDLYDSDDDSDDEDDIGTVRNGSMASGLNSASSHGSRSGSNRKPPKKEKKKSKSKKKGSPGPAEGFSNEAVDADDLDSDQEIFHIGMLEMADFENYGFEIEQDEHTPKRGSNSWVTSSSSKSSRQREEPPSSLSNLHHVNVSENYQPTFVEQERARRAKHRRQKDEKKKEKDEARMKSIWNMDNEMCTNVDLQFRVHPGLLQLFGQGVSPEFRPDDYTPTCLAMY